MKKLFFSLLVILCISVVTLISCRKNQENTKQETGAVTTEELSKDATFVSLNDAISRMDPKYLVLVYKDKRSTEEIVTAANELVARLQKEPDNILIQQELAAFYHFTSVDQLKQYSAVISESLKKLDAKYNFQKTLFVNGGGKIYYDARRMYAKAKIDAHPTNAKKPTGLWSDFVDAYYSEFDYNAQVYDEGLENNMEYGGGCNESCCFEQQACSLEAKNEFWRNLAKFGGTGAGTLGTASAAVGSKIGAFLGPEGGIFGGIGGAIWGGVVGGVVGGTIAYNIYSTSLSLCKTKYELCLNSKKH